MSHRSPGSSFAIAASRAPLRPAQDTTLLRQEGFRHDTTAGGSSPHPDIVPETPCSSSSSSSSPSRPLHPNVPAQSCPCPSLPDPSPISSVPPVDDVSASASGSCARTLLPKITRPPSPLHQPIRSVSPPQERLPPQLPPHSTSPTPVEAPDLPYRTVDDLLTFLAADIAFFLQTVTDLPLIPGESDICLELLPRIFGAWGENDRAYGDMREGRAKAILWVRRYAMEVGKRRADTHRPSEGVKRVEHGGGPSEVGPPAGVTEATEGRQAAEEGEGAEEDEGGELGFEALMAALGNLPDVPELAVVGTPGIPGTVTLHTTDTVTDMSTKVVPDDKLGGTNPSTEPPAPATNTNTNTTTDHVRAPPSRSPLPKRTRTSTPAVRADDRNTTPSTINICSKHTSDGPNLVSNHPKPPGTDKSRNRIRTCPSPTPTEELRKEISTLRAALAQTDAELYALRRTTVKQVASLKKRKRDRSDLHSSQASFEQHIKERRGDVPSATRGQARTRTSETGSGSGELDEGLSKRVKQERLDAEHERALTAWREVCRGSSAETAIEVAGSDEGSGKEESGRVAGARDGKRPRWAHE